MPKPNPSEIIGALRIGELLAILGECEQFTDTGVSPKDSRLRSIAEKESTLESVTPLIAMTLVSFEIYRRLALMFRDLDGNHA